MPPMTPEQALNTLSRCSSAGHLAGLLTDNDLDACRIAVQVLRQVIQPPKDEATPPKPAGGK